MFNPPIWQIKRLAKADPESSGGNGTRARRTWAGVRVEHSDALLAGAMLEESLLGAVLRCAGEAGQVNQDGNLLGGVLEGLRWQVEVETHLTASRGGIVGELEQLAAEGGDRGLGRDGHRDRF